MSSELSRRMRKDANLTSLSQVTGSHYLLSGSSEIATKSLETLARILAEWATPATGTRLYLYGSRVRGDHRPTSDVDICIDWGSVADADVKWWAENNEEDFISINSRLPGHLEIIEINDPLCATIMRAPRVHQDRNVYCVLMPPKPHRAP